MKIIAALFGQTVDQLINLCFIHLIEADADLVVIVRIIIIHPNDISIDADTIFKYVRVTDLSATTIQHHRC